MLFLIMLLVKKQDMQLEAGHFGNHVWFLDIHTPPELFSCKPSKATAGKWVSSCRVRTHYAETKPFLGAAKHLLSCNPPQAMQSLFSLHHDCNRESPFISLTFTFIFQRYLFFQTNMNNAVINTKFQRWWRIGHTQVRVMWNTLKLNLVPGIMKVCH